MQSHPPRYQVGGQIGDAPARRRISRSSRPRLWNDDLSSGRSRDAATRGAYLPFLQRCLFAEISGEPDANSSVRSRARAHRLRMRTPNTPARCIPEIRQRGRARARSAEWRWNPFSHARGTTERRTDRHDAAVLVVAGSDRSASRVHDRGISAGPPAASRYRAVG